MEARAPSLDRRIRMEIETKIHRGEWLPGHRLPPEHELQVQYGCARATVGKALAALVAAGLVKRRKKAGTIVAQPRVHAAVLIVPDIADVIAGRGAAYRFASLSRRVRVAKTGDGNETALLTSGTLVALSGLHFADEQPFALERRVISVAQVPEAETVDFSVTAPGTWLLRHIPWTNARHRIAAIGCGLADARKLALAAGAPCLQLDRWTWRDGEGVTYVRQIFPAARYDLVAEFTPQSLEFTPQHL